jgi:BMFP domain-containing protein YqiC
MNTEQIKSKIQDYITEVDKLRLDENFFDIDKARKVWTYKKLAELELRIEALEGLNKTSQKYEYPELNL